MNSPTNLLELVAVLYKWRWPIIILTFSAGLISAIIALTLPNYYRATTTFYAASPDLSKPGRIFGYSSFDINYYGTRVDVDRLLTIGYSEEIANFLIDSFELYKHYDIDPNSPKGKFRVKNKIADHYKIKKTKYGAIELSVDDKDKYLAAEMANAARDKIDQIARELLRKSQEKLLATYERNIRERETFLQQLDDSLRNLRIKYGVFDPKSQGEILAQLITETESKLVELTTSLNHLKNNPNTPPDTIILLQARVKGLKKKFDELTSPHTKSLFNLVKFNQGKGLIDHLQHIYDININQIGLDRLRYEQIKSVYENPIPAIHLVEDATPPTVKSRPNRMLIVLMSMAVTFVLSIMIVLFIESYRHVDWKGVFKG